MSILDLCCGKGEMLATWARDHGVTGVGVDISMVSLAEARGRAVELGVADRVRFVHSNAAGYVSADPVDIAACVGATWIGEGVTRTVALLQRSLRPGGIMLIGEPFWRAEPPSQEAVEACHARSVDDFDSLPGLVSLLATSAMTSSRWCSPREDSWDRYRAAQWLNIRMFIDAHPTDDLAPELRVELTRGPLDYVRYARDLLGWGVFALMRR